MTQDRKSLIFGGVTRSGRRGATMVEFALVVPVLVCLMFGIVQYGIIMFAINSLSQVARDAARYASVHGLESTSDDVASDSASILAEIDRQCVSSGIFYSSISGHAFNPTYASGARANGGLITVWLTYNLTPQVFFPAIFTALRTSNSVTRSATCVLDVGKTYTPG